MFFSYSRDDSDEDLNRFYVRLESEVAKLSGASMFRDTRNVQLGTNWSDEIAKGLQHAKVMVCLFSRAYFASDWCGKEWTAFASRVANATGSPGNASPMIPVVWNVVDMMPSVAQELQYTHDSLGGAYIRKGLRHLAQLQKPGAQDKFTKVIRVLAEAIDAAIKQDLPPAQNPPDAMSLQNAFESPAKGEPHAEHGGRGSPGPRPSPEMEVRDKRRVWNLRISRTLRISRRMIGSGIVIAILLAAIAIVTLYPRHDADLRHDAANPICGTYNSLHAHAVGDEAVVMASDVGPLRYPDHGRIADFESGQGAEARTVFNQQISLLSDSAWRWGQSKVWYERIDESGKDGPGILRLSFDLSSRDPKQPRYVGIYFDFSFPPPVSYDVSQFHGIALSLKTSNIAMEVEVRIVLFSANICNSSYAFPTYIVPNEDLVDRWRKIKVRFDKFSDPPWYRGHGLQLDPRRVYRVEIVVVSPKKDVEGYIELDDIRFVE